MFKLEGIIVLGKTQDKIYSLYQEDIPARVVEDSIKMAKKCGLSSEKAAIYAITGAYTMGRIDVKYLTPRGLESLIQSLNDILDAAQNHKPNNIQLIADIDNAITKLQMCYEKTRDPL